MDNDNLVTLKLPSGSSFDDLPTSGLAALLRIHRIDPGGLGDLAGSVQKAALEMLAGGDGIEIDYRVTNTEILVELRGGGSTTSISAPRALSG